MDRTCVICGKELTGKQRFTCSEAHRREKSRRDKNPAKAYRPQRKLPPATPGDIARKRGEELSDARRARAEAAAADTRELSLAYGAFETFLPTDKTHPGYDRNGRFVYELARSWSNLDWNNAEFAVVNRWEHRMVIEKLDEIQNETRNAFARIEQLEAMRAEAIDHIRETVDKLAAQLADDERVTVAAQDLLFSTELSSRRRP
jgi:hypothetical protein